MGLTTCSIPMRAAILERDRRARTGKHPRRSRAGTRSTTSMASNIKGPGIYLAQFGADNAPFNSWDSITKWAAGHGFKGVQLPSWDTRLIDLERAASSKTYCDEIAGVARANGVEI